MSDAHPRPRAPALAPTRALATPPVHNRRRLHHSPHATTTTRLAARPEQAIVATMRRNTAPTGWRTATCGCPDCASTRWSTTSQSRVPPSRG